MLFSVAIWAAIIALMIALSCHSFHEVRRLAYNACSSAMAKA